MAPEETRLSTLAANPLAWLAASWPSAAVYTQVTCISPVPRLDSVSGSAPELMKTAPVQYEGCDAGPAASSGWAATGSAPQKADAGFAGRMIPVTTSRIEPRHQPGADLQPEPGRGGGGHRRLHRGLSPGLRATGREPSGHQLAVAGQLRAVGQLELRRPVPGGPGRPGNRHGFGGQARPGRAGHWRPAARPPPAAPARRRRPPRCQRPEPGQFRRKWTSRAPSR